MSNAILFFPFSLDLRRGTLSRGDTQVAVRPKTFAVLVHLAQHRGELVSKDDLLNTVWKDIAVTDDMPRICVRELRRAFGDDSRAPKYIETVRGRGYRFIGGECAPSSAMIQAQTDQNSPLVRAVSERLVAEGLVQQAWTIGSVCAVVAAATQQRSWSRRRAGAMQRQQSQPWPSRSPGSA